MIKVRRDWCWRSSGALTLETRVITEGQNWGVGHHVTILEIERLILWAEGRKEALKKGRCKDIIL